MQFRVEQAFRSPVDDVFRAYTEPALYALLGELPKLGRPEVVERWDDGDRVHLAVRYRFTGELSGAVRRVVHPERLTWVEHTVHDAGRHEVEFRIEPDHYADRLRAAGRSSLRASDDGARRVTEGAVVVTGVPFVGRAVEGAIVSGIREHLAAEVAAVERYLAAR